ncbi:MAG: hypothetical protein IJH11_00225 [Lachnospiraceae bacterium]|nr:hypothetical protein [Lachnospiraceae bacterium]
MGIVNKGKIAVIDGNMASVQPLGRDSRVTRKIVIPWHLRGDSGKLKKDTEVVYVEFDDGTGLLLGRADGDWGEYLPELKSDKIIDSGVRLAKHKHSGVESGSSNTGDPT